MEEITHQEQNFLSIKACTPNKYIEKTKAAIAYKSNTRIKKSGIGVDINDRQKYAIKRKE